MVKEHKSVGKFFSGWIDGALFSGWIDGSLFSYSTWKVCATYIMFSNKSYSLVMWNLVGHSFSSYCTQCTAVLSCCTQQTVLFSQYTQITVKYSFCDSSCFSISPMNALPSQRKKTQSGTKLQRELKTFLLNSQGTEKRLYLTDILNLTQRFGKDLPI